MLESRNSYGWGFIGSTKKGFEWHFEPDDKDPCYNEIVTKGGYPSAITVNSGTVYSTEEKAIREGKKWLRSTHGSRSGTITAIKAKQPRFDY